jgi:hypothetical protein
MCEIVRKEHDPAVSTSEVDAFKIRTLKGESMASMISDFDLSSQIRTKQGLSSAEGRVKDIWLSAVQAYEIEPPLGFVMATVTASFGQATSWLVWSMHLIETIAVDDSLPECNPSPEALIF